MQSNNAVEMRLADRLDTTRIYRVTGHTGGHIALVAMCPCRAPHRTLSDTGRIGGGQVPLPGEVSLAHNGGSFWMSSPSFDAMSWRCCGNRWRRVSQEYNFADVLNVDILAALAAKVMMASTVKPR